MAGSDWSQRPRPLATAVKPDGHDVDQVAGLLTAAHLEVAVVYEPQTIPPQAERHDPPMHWLAALAEPLTSSLNIGLDVPIPTLQEAVTVTLLTYVAPSKMLNPLESAPMAIFPLPVPMRSRTSCAAVFDAATCSVWEGSAVHIPTFPQLEVVIADVLAPISATLSTSLFHIVALRLVAQPVRG